MPPQLRAPDPPTSVPSGPPGKSYYYESTDTTGKWQIDNAGKGVAIYASGGGTPTSDTLDYLDRYALTTVHDPYSGAVYKADGWIYKAFDLAGNPNGHWFIGANWFRQHGTAYVFLVAYNTEPHGTAPADMEFIRWTSYAYRRS